MCHQRFLLAVGLGIAVAGCGSHEQPAGPNGTAPDATAAEAIRRELTILNGNWRTVSITAAGKTVEEAGGTITIRGEMMIMKSPSGEETKNSYRIDPSADPKAMDLVDVANSNAIPKVAIYEVQGNHLRICFGQGQRPAAFGADGRPVFLLRRE